jgi:hypothetical protein
MGKLGQKIERVDNATNEIMDEIREYFWIKQKTPYNAHDYDKIYSIIHNQLKKMI